MTEGKFQVQGGTLTVRALIVLGGPAPDEDQLLRYIEEIVAARGDRMVMDLRGAGSLQSTVLALCILAARKAAAAEKELLIKAHPRNASAIRLTGLEKLATVEME
jgi:anti-anti-sigma regulatory factor